MGYLIMGDYPGLEKSAGKMGASGELVHGLWAQLQSSTSALVDGGWEGEGAQAFFASMHDEIFPALARLTAALQAIEDTLRVSTKALQTQEDTNVRTLKNYRLTVGTE